MTEYLTSTEIKKFDTYKHIAPKTTLEKFYVEKFLVPLEKLYPASWSANMITLIGQTPMFLFMLYLWMTQNTTLREPIPDHMFIIAAVVLQWFSLNDCIDGMRAKRLKCGSPLGRVVDEAND